MPVAVSNLQRRSRVSVPRLRAIARRTLAALGRTDREVHVTVVDDRRIRALNTRYLGARRATDVLAFDLAGPGPARLWGEVIVSAETAARQARRLKVPLAVELDLLVVHGLLHLAGYDDHDARRARRMHERARQILAGRTPRAVPARFWSGLLEA
ncbi:MAG TPA: rRNA maturation RNase YbeY [Methylomirabilota bacterium]|nr:rRNA maturation RNase YbeY [Methylomirabilota bacterium]